jgi:hypothetical protein
MLSSGYAILYQKGRRYVQSTIFYLNKHKENNMKLYQKKVQPSYVSCQEMERYPRSRRGGGGGLGVRKEVGVEGMSNG